ncbi:hypothetical protein PCASD_01153 [Puccinia coronata f. sp. avenae]|uniref:Uncharacterized protein n=1 Tax=Puccinia coronata f. sp. avenae TaxID=200324 RepID=A0A2N5VLH2_9BASI|nr:hypothetical protein PCASD_01153 [Puccinia coronata f. sp. avenae]
MSTRRRIGNTTKIATRGCIVQDDKPAIPANEHKEADWEHYQDCHAWLHCARRQARSRCSPTTQNHHHFRSKS